MDRDRPFGTMSVDYRKTLIELQQEQQRPSMQGVKSLSLSLDFTSASGFCSTVKAKYSIYSDAIRGVDVEKPSDSGRPAGRILAGPELSVPVFEGCR